MSAQAKRSLKKYLKGYRTLMDSHKGTSVQEYRRFFRRLSEDLPAIQESRRHRDLLLAPHYNIFRVLPIERRETILHSPMLAHLLDPDASHGQGFLFLRKFFQVACAHARLVPPREPLEADEWSVRPEVYIGNGSIDLVIECPRQRYALVIENKIDASLERTQLPRYYRWLLDRRAKYVTRQLVFLTPTGRAPEPASKVPCFLMSYHRDIREFVKETVDQIRASRVRDMAAQYLAILHDWTKEETDEESTF